MFLKINNYFYNIEVDLISKLLLDNYFNLLRLQYINVVVFLFNLKDVKSFLVLKTIMALDNFCMQKPNLYTYDLLFNYKKNKINYMSKVTLRGFKLYNYLLFYKYILFSEFINNHFKQKNFYNSFKFKKLTIIPYMDEGYFKTNFYLQNRFIFKGGLFYQNLVVKQGVIL